LYLTFIADAWPTSFAHHFGVFEHGLFPFFFNLFYNYIAGSFMPPTAEKKGKEFFWDTPVEDAVLCTPAK
jgi:hypothetical protein